MASNDVDNFDQRIQSIPDYSEQINVGLNSFPGANERKIFDWIRDHQPQNPFFVKIEYGTNSGKTPDGKEIKSATIYVVNPLKSSGLLWWKKYRFFILYEPDWTLFKLRIKNFENKDELALKELLQ